jgi:23S rRNA (cytidine2498-2'-O)-methyltransferase
MIHANDAPLLFSVQRDSLPLALDELSGFLIGKPQRIDDECYFARVQGGFATVSAHFANKPPIFIRHICPVDEHIVFSGQSGEDELALILRAGGALLAQMESGIGFSVQVRFIGERRPYRPGQVSGELADRGTAMGHTLNVKAPEQIISIVVSANQAFLGLSGASENRSDWAGGEVRFLNTPERISRAEFKLLEAFSVFPLSIDGRRAVDLGAAPGGWSRVLSERGFLVTAVDPAQMDPRVSALSNVTHMRMRAQDFFKNAPNYDLLVNDMRMDPLDSADLMCAGADGLKPSAAAIMTLKLTQENPMRAIKGALGILNKRYRVIDARQLFHNRSEITVAMVRR